MPLLYLKDGLSSDTPFLAKLWHILTQLGTYWHGQTSTDTVSSNIRITRICLHCGKEFQARTTVTKTCSDNCAKRSYKARQRLAKVEVSNTQVAKIKAKSIDDLRQQEYLTVNESAILLRISRRTLY